MILREALKQVNTIPLSGRLKSFLVYFVFDIIFDRIKKEPAYILAESDKQEFMLELFCQTNDALIQRFAIDRKHCL